MTARSKLKWPAVAGGIAAILAATAVVLGMCRDAGLATPLDAAPKTEVVALREEIGEIRSRLDEVEKGQTSIKSRLDMLLDHFELKYRGQ